MVEKTSLDSMVTSMTLSILVSAAGGLCRADRGDTIPKDACFANILGLNDALPL